VSSDNPHGDITNSDFEQAAMVVQLDNIANSYDVRGATISNLKDNTPTLTRHFKGSTTTSGPAAYLCQISSLHQRYHRYCSEVSFIIYYLLRPGECVKSRSNAKDHGTLGKPFQLRHASFLLQNGKHHNAHLLTPHSKRRHNDFELSTMCMAMLSFDDQKSAARGD